MIAKSLVISNQAEIDKADEMNLKCEVVYVKRALLFDINEVHWSILDKDGNIDICINGVEFKVEYNNDLWEKLKLRFNA